MSFLPWGGAASHRLLRVVPIVFVTLGLPSLTLARGPLVLGDDPTSQGYARLDRVIEAEETGIARPSGVAWNAQDGQLVVFDAARPGTAVSITPAGAAMGTVTVGGAVAGTQVTHDATGDRLVALDPSGTSLTTLSTVGPRQGGSSRSFLNLGTRGLGHVDGVASDDGALWVLDGSGRDLFRLAADAAGTFRAPAAQRVDLAGLGVDLRGLAIDPASGHLFAYAPASGTLWELDPSGTAISTRDLSDVGLDDVRAMTIAPTADSTDDPAATSLYVADAGTAQGTGAGVYEVALAAPVLSPQVALAATSSATLVRTINTGSGSAWNPDSPDPSGLAFIPASETELSSARRDRLVSADGEVDETTGAGWHQVNVWFAPRNGAAQTATMNTKTASPTNREPVGVAYDTVRNELWISKDGNTSRVWVHNVSTGATLRSFSVSGAPYNNRDAEGLAFDSVNNILYMVDALDKDLVKVRAGGNGVIGTGGDDIVTEYDIGGFGATDPEGLDVHPVTGNIWVVSNSSSAPMIEVTPTGALVQTVSIQSANPNSPAGVAIAPPSGGGGGYNIYVADRMVDNNNNPNENDGRIYEFSVSGGSPTVPDPPTAVTATAGDASATVSWTAPANNGGSPIIDYTVTGSPGGTCTTTGLSCTVPGLTNGTAYTFTVTARNSIGSSAPSAPSNSVTPGAPTVPDPPTAVTATAGDASATVSWTAPANNGGSPIIDYTVTGSPGGTCTTTGLSCTVPGLTNGTAYTFTVTARNSIGSSAPSAPSNSVTPGSGPMTFNAFADAYVKQADPTIAFGATDPPTLIVRKATSNVHTYLKFEVTGLSGPPASAALRLCVTDPSNNAGPVSTASNFEANGTTPWAEGTVTWNTKPAIGTQLGSVGAVVAGTCYTWSLGSAITGNGTFTFVLTGGTSDHAWFSSKEGANPPQLIITP